MISKCTTKPNCYQKRRNDSVKYCYLFKVKKKYCKLFGLSSKAIEASFSKVTLSIAKAKLQSGLLFKYLFSTQTDAKGDFRWLYTIENIMNGFTSKIMCYTLSLCCWFHLERQALTLPLIYFPSPDWDFMALALPTVLCGRCQRWLSCGSGNAGRLAGWREK